MDDVWHLPGPETVTHPSRARPRSPARSDTRWLFAPCRSCVLRALGLVNPMMRELAEMAYEFEEPFVLDTTKYQSTFGAAGTPLADGRRRDRRLVPRPRRNSHVHERKDSISWPAQTPSCRRR